MGSLFIVHAMRSFLHSPDARIIRKLLLKVVKIAVRQTVAILDYCLRSTIELTGSRKRGSFSSVDADVLGARGMWVP